MKGKGIMNFRITYIPPFKAAISQPDPTFDFTETGILGKFDAYFSKLVPGHRDSFTPRDYLYYDVKKDGLVWMYALTEEMDQGEYETIDFEGGYYLSYHYKDGDNEANGILYKEANDYITSSSHFALDIRENHYPMGHIITPKEIIDVQGWAQMVTYIPIKVK